MDVVISVIPLVKTSKSCVCICGSWVSGDGQSLLLLAFQSLPVSALAGLGRRCVGESHEQVIRSQGYALADLRKKIDQLMTTNPPGKSFSSVTLICGNKVGLVCNKACDNFLHM